MFRCPVTLKKTNCFVLAFTNPGINGDPVKLTPNRFELYARLHHGSSGQRKVRRIQRAIAALIKHRSMRLRRIEPTKSTSPAASPTTTASSAPRAAATGSAESSTTNQSTKHPRNIVCDIAHCATLELSVCNRVLYSLPDVILANFASPFVCPIAPLTVTESARSGSAPPRPASEGSLRSGVVGARIRACIRGIQPIARHVQRLHASRNPCACRCRCLSRLLLLRSRGQLQSKLRDLLWLAAVLACGVDQNFLRVCRKRRQLCLHHITPITRNRHGKRAVHIRRRRVSFPCQGVRRGHADAGQGNRSGLHCSGDGATACLTRRSRSRSLGCCGSRRLLSLGHCLAPGAPRHHQAHRHPSNRSLHLILPRSIER